MSLRENADLKQAATREPPARSKDELKRTMVSHMRSLSRRPDRVRSFFGHPTFRYAALAFLEGQVAAAVPDARAVISELQADLRECLDELRSMTYLLHPPPLDDLGLFVALDAYCNGFAKRSGLAVTFSVVAGARPDRKVANALFRITQEGLRNAHKHSGGTQVDVQVSGTLDDPGVIALEIRDNGSGLPRQVVDALASGGDQGLKQLGVGLLGMIGRVRDLGGRMAVRARETGGSVVAVHLPYVPAAQT